MLKYGRTTQELAERFRVAIDELGALDARTAPRAELEAALRAYDDAACALALAALSDITLATN